MDSLTKTKLDSLIRNPPATRKDIPDGQVSGLIARVNPTGIITWSLQYRVSGAGGVTGRGHKLKGAAKFRITIGRYPAMSIAEARNEASRNKLLADRGDNPQHKLEQEATAGGGTVKEIADAYMSRHVKRNTPRSAAKVQNTLDNHIIPALGNKLASNLTKRDITALLEKLLDRKRRSNGRRYGGNEAARFCRQLLHAMFVWACKQDMLVANPVSGIGDPVKAVARDRVLSMEEIRGVWRACSQLAYPFGPFYKLLLLTGCRRAEWGAARWAWIDWDERVMRIPSDAYKSKRVHIVPLSRDALEILGSLPRGSQGDFIFSGTEGARGISGYSYGKQRLGKALATELGSELENWRPHDFRRSAATHMRRLGIDRHVVKRVLGHAERDITAVYDRYNLLDEAREAAERWAHELIGKSKEPLPGMPSPTAANDNSTAVPLICLQNNVSQN